MSDNNDPPDFELAHPRLIICEGAGDKAFFRHLIENRNLPRFDICHPGKPLTETGGWSGFGDLLNALTTKRGWRNLRGILFAADNDDDPSTSFTNVAKEVAKVAKFVAPAAPLSASRVAGLPTVVVMMLPNAHEQGALETLCLQSASVKNPITRDCLEEFLRCANVLGWQPAKLLKLRMRCMLAATCTTDPNTSLVHAWSNRGDPIPLEHASFDSVADVLRRFDEIIA